MQNARRLPIARVAWRLEQDDSAVDGIYFASEMPKTKMTRKSLHLVPPLPPIQRCVAVSGTPSRMEKMFASTK